MFCSFNAYADGAACADISTEVKTQASTTVIPNSVLQNINLNIEKMYKAVSNVMVIGQALNCHAVYTAKNNVTIAGIHLFSYPSITIWLTGTIIYIMGFMITLSITFYLVDIGFKLGLALIMLPVGIALWPFAWTKDKLVAILSMILKSAAVFAFLSLTITYTYQLIEAALDGSDILVQNIDENKVDYVADNFTLTATMFLLCVFALVYGMQLIGSTITDYVDEFFPDQIMDKASPIHGSMTQMMDFAKQKVVAPVASYAKDVAKAQAGHVMIGTGKLMTGQYNQKIRQAAHYAANPNEAADKLIQKTGKGAAWVVSKGGKAGSSLLTGSLGRAILGKKASQNLQNSINERLDKTASKINAGAQSLGAQANQSIKQSAVGQRLDKAKQDVKATAGSVKSVKDELQEKLKNSKIGTNLAKLNNRFIKKPENWANKKIQDAENAKQAKLNKIDNKIDKALHKVEQWRSKALNLSNHISFLKTKENDGKVMRFAKGTGRGAVKCFTFMARPLVNLPAFAARSTLNAARKVWKVPTRLNSARKKFIPRLARSPIVITRTIVKFLNPKNAWNSLGQALISGGRRNTHNKKTQAQLAAIARAREEEIAKREREERLRKEAEENRD
jgi:hypothetical protein